MTALLMYDGWTLDTAAHRAAKGRHTVPLTATETAVLALLIENAGQVVTREQFLREIWGVETPLQTRTIDACIVRLRRKLPLSRKLRTVYHSGYRLVG